MYTENYKTLLKVIIVEANKWRDIQVHRLEELILLKCFYYQHALQIPTILIKIPTVFSYRNGKKNAKIHRETQKTLDNHSNFGKRTKLKVSHFLISKYMTKLL